MKVLGIILIVFGVIGLMIGGKMFGDIGIAAWLASIISVLTGVGFIKVDKKINELNKNN